jgi:hypothetical protein
MGIFRNLLRSTGPARPRTAKPMLEALDQRLVLSTASSSLHAVMDGHGNTSIFYINRQNGAFYEHDAYYGTRQLSGPDTVQAFSAGIDTYGYADAFVKAGDKSFWEYTNSAGWHEILGPNYVGSFAAVKGDRVYFQNWDKSLWRYTDGWGFAQLAGPGAVQSIDAVTDNAGADAVFAIRGDNTFGEYYGGSYYQLSGAYTIKAGFSAGVDMHGYADVYGLAGDGSFWEHNSYLGWRQLDAPGTVKVISATFNEKVDVIDANGWLVKYDQNGRKIVQDSGSYFTEISAARDNDVCTVVWDNSGWERTAGGAWNQFAAAGTML